MDRGVKPKIKNTNKPGCTIKQLAIMKCLIKENNSLMELTKTQWNNAPN